MAARRRSRPIWPAFFPHKAHPTCRASIVLPGGGGAEVSGLSSANLQNCTHRTVVRGTTADTQAIGELRLRRVSARNCSGAYSRNCSGAYFCMKLEEAVISYLLRQSAKNHDREAALPPSDRRAKSVWRYNQDRSNCVRCRGRSESAGH